MESEVGLRSGIEQNPTRRTKECRKIPTDDAVYIPKMLRKEQKDKKDLVVNLNNV